MKGTSDAEYYSNISSKKSFNISKESAKKLNNNKNIYMYLLLLPAVIATFIFAYLPMCGIIIAFKDYDILKGFSQCDWVGFKYFKDVLVHPKFLQAILNTLIYSSVILFGSFPLPIILALMFNEIANLKFKRVVQTISYMPYFLSWISVVGLTLTLFATEGPINNILFNLLGPQYEKTNILMYSENFLSILFVSHVWKTLGWSSVIFLAAISGIDPVLYEAAEVDGCGKLKKIIHITLPGIMPTAIIVLIMSLGSLVSSNFEQVFGFQNIFTQEKTEVINTLIYRLGIVNGQYSISTAFGLMQGLVSILLVFTSNKLAKKFLNISIW